MDFFSQKELSKKIKLDRAAPGIWLQNYFKKIYTHSNLIYTHLELFYTKFTQILYHINLKI